MPRAFEDAADELGTSQQRGHTAHVLPLEWSRIEPAEGQWNYHELERYGQAIEELTKNSLASFVTLHQFANPRWFADRGGWLAGDSAELFARYADVAAQHLGDRVDFWITITEPTILVAKGFIEGSWPPFSRKPFSAWRASRNLTAAHKGAYRAIHRHVPRALVGGAHHLQHAEDSLRPVLKTSDFIGAIDSGSPSEEITRRLLGLKQYKKPIYFTENKPVDTPETLRAIETAQKGGADVRGYFHAAHPAGSLYTALASLR